MRKIESLDELKAIELDILLKIHQFCLENNINYSLACGTLLGAVRHQGFIPWDDDVDIQLLRDEYEKLIKSFPKIYDNIAIISLERDKRWNRPYAKAYDIRTIEKENSKGNIEGIGIGIDIFPIDKVPEDAAHWKSYNRYRSFIIKLNQLKQLRWSNKRSILKNLTVCFSQILLSPFSLKCLAIKIDKISKRYRNTHSQFVFENCLGMMRGRERFLLSDFSQYIDISFEGYKFKALAGYDNYLKQTFGDYMVLPPEEKRVSHHDFIAYWK